jgi:hypothetical protein
MVQFPYVELIVVLASVIIVGIRFVAQNGINALVN